MEPRIPDNVIRDLRTSAGLSQKELAELAGVTPGRVLREEQFVYERPSPAILQALSEKFEKQFKPDEIVADYLACRERMHQDFYDDMVLSDNHLGALARAVDYAVDYYDVGAMKAPTRLFREHLFQHYGLPDSAIKFTQYTGMHPGTLSDIELGKVPWEGCDAFIKVLLRMGMTYYLIRNLGVVHDDYFVKRVV